MPNSVFRYFHEGRRNHSFRHGARNSALDFGSCNFLIRSSSSSSIRRCGPFSVSSLEKLTLGSLVRSLSFSYEICSGGLGRGEMDGGMLGYFKFLLFLMFLYIVMSIIQK